MDEPLQKWELPETDDDMDADDLTPPTAAASSSTLATRRPSFRPPTTRLALGRNSRAGPTLVPGFRRASHPRQTSGDRPGGTRSSRSTLTV